MGSNNFDDLKKTWFHQVSIFLEPQKDIDDKYDITFTNVAKNQVMENKRVSKILSALSP